MAPSRCKVMLAALWQHPAASIQNMMPFVVNAAKGGLRTWPALGGVCLTRPRPLCNVLTARSAPFRHDKYVSTTTMAETATQPIAGGASSTGVTDPEDS
ncbi:hypothetical protein MRB53_041265 [Persea americana]|nr:hypothetical protein MRB53_041265 [Persea americana]